MKAPEGLIRELETRRDQWGDGFMYNSSKSRLNDNREKIIKLLKERREIMKDVQIENEHITQLTEYINFLKSTE